MHLSEFVVFAFSLPFELILEILFGIDTILKPFRVFSLLIIGTYLMQVIRYGFYYRTEERTDFFIYLIFIYGVIISLYNLIVGVFSMKLFLNDLFLAGLNLTVFFIFKKQFFTGRQAMTIFSFLIFGYLLNSFYTFSGAYGVFFWRAPFGFY